MSREIPKEIPFTRGRSSQSHGLFFYFFFLAKTHPCTWKWELHRGIVPPEEDYFDYLPVDAAVWTFLYGIREYLTLTRENVARFHFSDFKVATLNARVVLSCTTDKGFHLIYRMRLCM